MRRRFEEKDRAWRLAHGSTFVDENDRERQEGLRGRGCWERIGIRGEVESGIGETTDEPWEKIARAHCLGLLLGQQRPLGLAPARPGRTGDPWFRHAGFVAVPRECSDGAVRTAADATHVMRYTTPDWRGDPAAMIPARDSARIGSAPASAGAEH